MKTPHTWTRAEVARYMKRMRKELRGKGYREDFIYAYLARLPKYLDPPAKAKG